MYVITTIIKLRYRFITKVVNISYKCYYKLVRVNSHY